MYRVGAGRGEQGPPSVPPGAGRRGRSLGTGRLSTAAEPVPRGSPSARRRWQSPLETLQGAQGTVPRPRGGRAALPSSGNSRGLPRPPPPPSPPRRPGPSPTAPSTSAEGSPPGSPRCRPPGPAGLPGRARSGGRRGEDSSVPRPAPSLSPRYRRGAAGATPARHSREAPRSASSSSVRPRRGGKHSPGGPERGSEGHREGN